MIKTIYRCPKGVFAVEGLEVIQQMKKGDFQAYETWLEMYAKNIAQFAFQYGCTVDESSEVVTQTFRILFKKLEGIANEPQLICLMYQIASEKLVDVELSETENLQFEEDKLLHNKIIKLETGLKLCLILSKFHALSELEIASITGETQGVVQQNILEAKAQLGEVQVEKQLSFLDKSYNRLKFQIDNAQILQTFQMNDEIVHKKKVKLPRRTFIPLFAGGIILIALVLFSVVNSPEYKKNSAVKYIEKLKQTYEEELENTYIELGFEEESFNEIGEHLGSSYLGTQERLKFEMLIKRIERVLEEQGTINKKKIEVEFEELITDLETPAQMAESIFEEPLSTDLKASEEFIQKYLAKYLIINQHYHMLVYDQAAVIGDIDFEQIENYREEFQPLLRAMEKQNIYLDTESHPGYLIPQYKKGEFSDQLRASIHEDLSGYIAMQEFLYQLPSSDDELDRLFEMEKSLFATSEGSEAYDMLAHTYTQLLSGIIKGREDDEVFDSDGKINQKLRSKWKEIALTEGDSPSALIMQKIIAEMEENEWEVSEMYVFLDWTDIEQALSLAKKDDLASYHLVEKVYDENNYQWIQPSPKQAFEKLVALTYERYIEDYDVKVLEASNPITIFGMFYYANEKKDPKTMWYLQSRIFAPESLEAYVSNWQPEVLSLKDMDFLHFDPYEQLITYSNGDEYHDNIKMIYEVDRWVVASLGS